MVRNSGMGSKSDKGFVFEHTIMSEKILTLPVFYLDSQPESFIHCRATRCLLRLIRTLGPA